MENIGDKGIQTEVYSRVVGYFRPIQNWNEGKKQEFFDRHMYNIKEEDLPETEAIKTA